MDEHVARSRGGPTPPAPSAGEASTGVGAGPSAPTVAVVITAFNHAHFLADAIGSVLAQTRPADEVIVVDDGSTDDPAAVVRDFPGVRFLRQSNRGLSAARNTGLHAARAEMIAFLDADDRLLPDAIEAGLACHARSAGCALVYGGHRYISRAGVPFGESKYSDIGADGYTALLGGNVIAMHAAVMYRRAMLAEAGGFDTALPRCEDYDVYLRLARRGRIGSHPGVVAEYRKHGGNMSSDHWEMLHWALAVQARHAQRSSDAAVMRARRDGRTWWRAYYAGQLLGESRAHTGRLGPRLLTLSRAVRASPRLIAGRAARKLMRVAERALPPPIAARLVELRRGPPPLGRVRFGSFHRTAPIDDDFGHGRGTAIDRFYIEAFLDANKADIAGRVLEVGDDAYSRRFGGERVLRQDVLHVHPGSPRATIVGDLSAPGVLPPDSFDSIVLTQTLHLIYDVRGAIAALHDALRPGGVLLLTVPGISQIDRHEWAGSWYWALTPLAASRLFADAFGAGAVRVEGHGNVFAATAFLQGVALEEVPRAKLAVQDPAYPVVVTVRARKPSASGAGP